MQPSNISIVTSQSHAGMFKNIVNKINDDYCYGMMYKENNNTHMTCAIYICVQVMCVHVLCLYYKAVSPC